MGAARGDRRSTLEGTPGAPATQRRAIDAVLDTMSLRAIIAVATIVLFASSALRHALFQSTAGDLGIFDQAVYLISRGMTPISSFLGFHIIGDHAAWVLYPMALLYMVHPTAYWLLLVQSSALALGAWPMFRLAQHAGVGNSDARLMAIAYLLYPVVYNANLNDFHTDAIAVPALLAAVDAARRGRFGWFCACTVLVLGSKDVFGLTVAAMGLWLFAAERRRACGVFAAVIGLSWFAFVLVVVIPRLTGGAPHALFVYSYLGTGLAEIIGTVATRPWVPLMYIFSISSLGYLAGLLSPLLWGLVPRHLSPLISAVPAVLLNLLSETRLPRHLTTWYSLPILPFMLLAALAAMSSGQTWVRQRRVILAWSLLGFLVFARYPRLVGYLGTLNTWSATRAALGKIDPAGGVFADNCLVPHVTHRATVHVVPYNFAVETGPIPDDVEYVFLNARHPCSLSPDAATALGQRLQTSLQFEAKFAHDGVLLFQRRR